MKKSWDPAGLRSSRGIGTTAGTRAPMFREEPMADPIRILAVHGIGGQDQAPGSWQPEWTQALTNGIGRWTDRQVQVEFLAYDDIFAKRPPSPGDVAAALVKLAWNGLASVGSELLGRTRGFLEVPDVVRWT